MLSGEKKKYGLRTARAPALIDGLSNTVLVYTGAIPEYCYIGFTPDFVAAVGSQMLHGVSLSDIAFLQVTFDRSIAKWVIFACYIETWEQQVLWMSGTKPTWLKNLRRIRENGHHTEAAHTSSHARRRNTTTTTSGRRIVCAVEQ